MTTVMKVVWLEAYSDVCKELSKEFPDFRFKCTFGSKRMAFKRWGICDDDRDFAFRFINACQQASECIAIVRDENIVKFINAYINPEIKQKVKVIKTPGFLMDNDTMLRLARSVLEEIYRYKLNSHTQP